MLSIFLGLNALTYMQEGGLVPSDGFLTMWKGIKCIPHIHFHVYIDSCRMREIELPNV